MISITAILKSKPEHLIEIKNLLTHLVSETRKEEACIRYDLHTSDNVFILWEEWKDQSGIDIHNTKPYLIEFISKTESLVSTPIQVYKTVQTL